MTKPQMVVLSSPFPMRVEAIHSGWVLATAAFPGRGLLFFFKAPSAIVKEDLVLLDLLNKREQAACEHVLVSVVYKANGLTGAIGSRLTCFSIMGQL